MKSRLVKINTRIASILILEKLKQSSQELGLTCQQVQGLGNEPPLNLDECKKKMIMTTLIKGSSPLRKTNFLKTIYRRRTMPTPFELLQFI